MARTRRSDRADPLSGLPAWARKLGEKYYSRTVSTFVLYGAVRDLQPLTRGCRCDPDYVRSVIARFPEEERAEMADEDGVIRVNCEFCSTSFPIHFH